MIDTLSATLGVAAVIAACTAQNRWRRWQHVRANEQLGGVALTDETVSETPNRPASAREVDLRVSGGVPVSRVRSGMPVAVAGGRGSDVTPEPGGGVRLIDPVAAQDGPGPALASVEGGESTVSGLVGRRRAGWGFTAAAAALAVGSVLVVGERPAVPAFLYLSAVLVPLIVCDVRLHRLPLCFVSPAYPVAALAFVVDALMTGEWWRAAAAGGGFLALGGGYLVMSLLPGALMGFGDVRLAGVLGAVLAWLGWGTWATGALGAFVLASLFSVPRLVLRRTSLSSRVPFGPFMLVAAAAAVALAA